MDVEKTIEFILDQQAKFFAGMEQMRQEFRQDMEEMRQEMREQAAAQGKINMALGKAMLGLTEHIDRLTAAQAATDERLKTLTAAQAATDERLNALIAVVDGIVRHLPAR